LFKRLPHLAAASRLILIISALRSRARSAARSAMDSPSHCVASITGRFPAPARNGWWIGYGSDALTISQELWSQTHPVLQAGPPAQAADHQPMSSAGCLRRHPEKQNEANSAAGRAETSFQRSRRTGGISQEQRSLTTEVKFARAANAIQHGLTAETVIGALEDSDDYAAFESTITADYDAQSAVERDLVLRLASLLWRLPQHRNRPVRNPS
jgi:hypothetical protein